MRPSTLSSTSQGPTRAPQRASHPVPIHVLLKEGRDVAAIVRGHAGLWSPPEGAPGEPHEGLQLTDPRVGVELAAELVALCDAVENTRARRSLSETPKAAMLEAKKLVLRARKSLAHLAALHQDRVSEELERALAKHNTTHVRPRSLATLPEALRSLAKVVEQHLARGGARAALRLDMPARARTLANLLERAHEKREGEVLARQAAPSPRSVQIARIEAILGMIRAAAEVTFDDENRHLYRAVTSEYQRVSRRIARARSKDEPAPVVATLAGHAVKRRPRRSR